MTGQFSCRYFTVPDSQERPPLKGTQKQRKEYIPAALSTEKINVCTVCEYSQCELEKTVKASN